MQALEPNEPEDFCIPKNSDLKNFYAFHFNKSSFIYNKLQLHSYVILSTIGGIE